MTTAPSLPTYKEIQSALKKIPGAYHAAQVHGMMCGLICAGATKKDTHWKMALDEIKKYKKSEEMLQMLYETSYDLLMQFSFEFNLLLPEDKKSINQRAESLGLWCQGFLMGLQRGNIPIEEREPSEITEALNDIIEISQVNYSEIIDNEEDEVAYFELVEYVRLAALMIFHELHPAKGGRTTKKSLH